MTDDTSRIALVTGASSGLGREIALNLARRGADVIVTYRSSADAAEAVVKELKGVGGRAAGVVLDISAIDSLDQFHDDVQRILRDTFDRGNLDWLVNNAGAGLSGKPIAEVAEDEFDSLVSVDLKGTFFVTQKLLPLIADGGRIINVTSSLTRYSLPGAAPYAMMKGALEVFTRYLAKELADRSITANAVAPGPIETDFAGGWVRDPEFVRQITPTIALRRVGQPDDVGPLVASLLSDDARFVTAQRIEVSGGQGL